MSNITITIISLGVVFTLIFILRWKRHFFMYHICPSEILFLDTIKERNQVCDDGYLDCIKHWSSWLALVLYSIILALVSILLLKLVKTVSPANQWSLTGAQLAILFPAIFQFMLIPLLIMRYRKWMRKYLRSYLNENGIPICMSCGYDLRNLEEHRCPECGTEFEMNQSVSNQ